MEDLRSYAFEFEDFATRAKAQGLNLSGAKRRALLVTFTQPPIFIGKGGYGSAYWVRCQNIGVHDFSAVLKIHHKETNLAGLQENVHILQQLQGELGLPVIRNYYICAGSQGQGYLVLMTYTDRQGWTTFGRGEEGTNYPQRTSNPPENRIRKINPYVFSDFITKMIRCASRATELGLNIPPDAYFFRVREDNGQLELGALIVDFDNVDTRPSGWNLRNLGADNFDAVWQFLDQVIRENFDYNLHDELSRLLESANLKPKSYY